MEIDVILLSYTKNESIFKMTKKCIESILNSEKEYSFNIILVETEKSGKYNYDYEEVNVIIPNETFNYNKFLNIGLRSLQRIESGNSIGSHIIDKMRNTLGETKYTWS